MMRLLSAVCQITPHSRDPVYRRLKALTSNGDSLDYAWEYAMARRDVCGIGMTRSPQTFLSAICACLAGIGLPSRYP